MFAAPTANGGDMNSNRLLRDKCSMDTSFSDAKRPSIWAMLLALTLAIPTVSSAQKMERPKDPEVGDKIVRNWILNNKAQQVTQEVQSVTDTEIRESQKVGDKTFDLVLSKSNLAISAALCESNGQRCTFAPALEWVAFPLEKGKKWTGTMVVTGESFTAEVEYERKVEAVEKIKTAAGEYEAYRINFNGRIKGKDSKGASFSGKEDGKMWVGLISGKPVPLRTEYRNSFGERVTTELVSAALK